MKNAHEHFTHNRTRVVCFWPSNVLDVLNESLAIARTFVKVSCTPQEYNFFSDHTQPYSHYILEIFALLFQFLCSTDFKQTPNGHQWFSMNSVKSNGSQTNR